MSQPLISRSQDLQRLRYEGYEISVMAGHLAMAHVPYVTPRREIAYGTLVSDLTLAGDVTARPQNHKAYFVGEQPCDKNGAPLSQLIHSQVNHAIAANLHASVMFSRKPKGGYEDYYDKMTTYASIIVSHAHSLDPTVTAKTGRAIPSEGDEETVFNYVDTASARAGTAVLNGKLAGQRIAIVGLGGTGAYVLDLVVKTPVTEIHLFDGDTFLQHNAFRAPSAASLDALSRMPKKVDYYAELYAPMRRGIIPHAEYVDASNASLLQVADFTFLCMEGNGKKEVVSALEQQGAAFIDTGMGLISDDTSLGGIARVTTSTPDKRNHFASRVPLTEQAGLNEYESNIQVADMNCLNAALAVIKWKKLCGFYRDLKPMHSCTYTIDVDLLLSEDPS